MTINIFVMVSIVYVMFDNLMIYTIICFIIVVIVVLEINIYKFNNYYGTELIYFIQMFTIRYNLYIHTHTHTHTYIYSWLIFMFFFLQFYENLKEVSQHISLHFCLNHQAKLTLICMIIQHSKHKSRSHYQYTPIGLNFLSRNNLYD